MQLTREGDVYRSGQMLLGPDPPEEILVRFYYDWKASGVLDIAFYGEPTSLSWFLQWFSRKEVDAHGNSMVSNLGAYHQSPVGTYTPLGLVWINRTFVLPGGFKRAEVAMAFCRGVSPPSLMTIAQMAIEWGFEERKLDALIGTTPVENRAAMRYGRRLGFTVAGPVHGMCTWHGNLSSVMLQSMTKDMWVARSPFEEHTDNMGVPSGAVSQYASKQGYAGDDKIHNPFAHPLEGSVIAGTENLFGYKEDFTGQAIEPTPEEAAKLSNVGQVERP